MLAITKEAAAAVDGIVTARESPDEAGIRLSLAPGSADGDGAHTDIEMNLAPGPESGDEVLAEAPIYLEPAAANALDDKLLDAEIHGDRVRFAVRDKGEVA
jgi:Fe-S cluster assembly iron-binding protein IscA